MPEPQATTLLHIENLSKSYGTVTANRDISLEVRRGEVVALLGENGAGKSTLVKQIFGLVTPDSGAISIKGDRTPIKDPRDAIRRGVGMVHQHFQLVPVMTVAENIMLGHESATFGVLNLDQARDNVRQLAKTYGLFVDPDATIEDLPVGTQQRVEILKALSRKVDLLILDEPTAVLTPQETDELLEVMRALAESGTSIVFISHKLREVIAVADRCYVLRQGEVVGEVDEPRTSTTSDLASLMVGRDVVLRVDKSPAEPGAPVLRVRDLEVQDDRGLAAVRGLTLEVRSGEVMGIAGVEGNGQRELVECIAGMRPSSAGSITLGEDDITGATAYAVNNAGVGHIPEDREKHGIVASYSIADNLVLNRYDEEPFARGFIRDFGAVRTNAATLREEFDIRANSVEVPAGALSGGNKQKVVLAREIAAQPRLLIAAQPTRGVDVGSIEFIHKRIVAARDQGAAVLLVSAELDEILSLADRIGVIHGGVIVAELESTDADRTTIGRLMAGDTDHYGPASQ